MLHLPDIAPAQGFERVGEDAATNWNAQFAGLSGVSKRHMHESTRTSWTSVMRAPGSITLALASRRASGEKARQSAYSMAPGNQVTAGSNHRRPRKAAATVAHCARLDSSDSSVCFGRVN